MKDCRLNQKVDEFKRMYLEVQLAACGGSVVKLAPRLGLERSMVYRLVKQLGVGRWAR